MDEQDFTFQAAQELAGLARERVLPRIPSRTLARSLILVATPPKTVGGSAISLRIPHYWAEFVHDGRKRITLSGGKKLIFFTDESFNPRSAFGTRYPVRMVDRLKLSSSDFAVGTALNETTRRSIMVVTPTVGPVTATPFFEPGLRGLGSEASNRIPQRFSKLVLSKLVSETERIVISF